MKTFNKINYLQFSSLFGLLLILSGLGCAHKEGDRGSMFESSSEIIERISDGENVNQFLKKRILVDEKERLGFSLVFNGIRNPRSFHLSDDCHRKSRICLGFDYQVDGEDEISRMLVGFILEDKMLKISNYTILLSGTF